MLVCKVRETLTFASSVAVFAGALTTPVVAAHRSAIAAHGQTFGVQFGRGAAPRDRDTPHPLEASPAPKPSATAFPDFANPLHRHRMAEAAPFVPLEDTLSF